MKALSVTFIISATACPAFAQQWCPLDPTPECNDDGTSCKGSCDAFGDPITIVGGNSFYKTLDVSLDIGKGEFYFTRSFISSAETWTNTTGGIGLSNAFPRPFSGPSNTSHWWSNALSVIFRRKNTTQLPLPMSYLLESGVTSYLEDPQPDGGAGRWLPVSSASPHIDTARQERVRTTALGYEVLRDDGRTYRYERTYPMNSSYDVFLLTSVLARDGSTVATYEYADPIGLGCPKVASANSPYLSRVVTGSGHILNFTWDRAPSGATDRRCYIVRVDYAPPSGTPNTTLASYGYADLGNGERRLATMRHPHDAGEDYFYSPLQFRVERASAGPFVTHTLDAGTNRVSHSNTEGAGPVLTTAYQTSARSPVRVLGHQSCLVSSSLNNGAKRAIATITGTTGDSLGTTGTMTTTYESLRSTQMHRYARVMETDDCPFNPEGCSTGTVLQLYGPPEPILPGTSVCDTAHPSIPQGVIDKRGNITLDTKIPYNPGMPNPLLVPFASLRGATWDGGSGVGVVVSPLELAGHTWVAGANAAPRRNTVQIRSALNPSTDVATNYFYEPTSGGGLRLSGEIMTAYAKDNLTSWSNVPKARAIFYSPLANDPLNRIEYVRGPCWVASSTATACDPSLNPGGWPSTRLEYYPIGSGSGKNSGRLQKVTQYPQGESASASTFLVTQFSDYTELGDPKTVIDSNGVITSYTYEGRKRKTQVRTVSAQVETTTWYYDNEQLAAIGYPEGNFEVFCYRTSAFPSCTGTLTSKLRWRAKTNGLPPAAFQWSERIDYTYDQNGFLTGEQRFTQSEATPRYKRSVNPDLHGRETFAKAGGAGAGQDFRTFAHFDGANNRDALGPPMNNAPDFCRSLGADSPLCWWYRYDRADRLNRANAPNGLARTCFDYDAVGNIKGVTIGDATGGAAVNCDPSNNAPGVGTAATASSTSLQYTWDDFGNVIQVKNTGVDDAASAGTLYLYDAQGNVIEKRTAAMGTAYRQRLNYDCVGRLTSVESVPTSGSAEVLYTLNYDTSSVTPPAALTNTKGRLARRNDSYGDTWYSYDEDGQVLVEYRARTGCNPAIRGTLCQPHTSYSWSKNGNLKTITYPYGRIVQYNYWSGALVDRVRNVWAGFYLAPPNQTSRQIIDAVAWEPYGGLRAYQMRLNGGSARGVEYFLGKTPEDAVGGTLCDDGVTGPPDGSGRARGFFVSTSKLSLNPSTHVDGDILSQRYVWNEDQVGVQKTCLAESAGYQQSFTYDSMQRLTAETQINGAQHVNDWTVGTTRTFDSRGNRIDSTRNGYDAFDYVYDGSAKDRLTRHGQWLGFLTSDYFVKYDSIYNESGVLTSVEGKAGPTTKWTMDLGYSTTKALSDVFISSSLNGKVFEYWYDAFGRRRMKRDPLSYGTEFTYDLGHQLLVDQTWDDLDEAGSNLDEYVWLDGRPVVVFRGMVDGVGVHETEVPGAFPSLNCYRPGEGSDLHCGIFHLATNLQGYPMLALSDYNGAVANFALPDADGVANQPRFVQYGGQGTSDPQKFDVPATFSKQARFRTLYTGGSNTYWGFYPGVASFQLTTPTGASDYPVYGAELSRFWSTWSPLAAGTDVVTWSTQCSGPCSSAADMLEWRVWETDAPRFSTKLRFPGQYHDYETDYFENWNRYYDPTMGRYLSPEPLLQDPDWVAWQGQWGHPVPAYGYARNNPVRYVDLDGLDPGSPFPFPDEAAKDALAYTYPRSTSEKWEYAGNICYGNRGFCATDPVPGPQDWNSTPPGCPAGTKEWGRYHTHGGNTKGANAPSPEDVRNTTDPRFSPNSYVSFPNGGGVSIHRGKVKPLFPPGTLSPNQAPGRGPPFPNKLNRKFQP